jgi:hypothetical protein
MTEKRSAMVFPQMAITTETDCSECGEAKAVVYLKFRYSRERLPICHSCWTELARQVEAFDMSDSVPSKFWRR